MDPGDKIEVVRLSRPKEFRAYGLLQSVDDGGGVVLEGDSRIFNSVHYGFTVIGQFPWTSSVPGDKPGVKIMNERSETKQPEDMIAVVEKIEGWEMTSETLKNMPMHRFMEVDADVWVMRIMGGWVYQFKKGVTHRFFVPGPKVPEPSMNRVF